MMEITEFGLHTSISLVDESNDAIISINQDPDFDKNTQLEIITDHPVTVLINNIEYKNDDQISVGADSILHWDTITTKYSIEDNVRSHSVVHRTGSWVLRSRLKLYAADEPVNETSG